MNLSRILVYTIVLFISVSCHSQNLPVTTDKVPNIEAKALLWEIAGNGLQLSSFLFGTIHIISEEDFFFPDGTLSAIDQSANLVFEIDMEEMSDLSNLMPIMQKAFMEDGMTLKDLLSTEDYGIVEDHFEQIGLPLFLLERIKPMFLTVFASGDISPTDLQSGKLKSYEMEFTEIAKTSNKDIGGLETIDFQISLFDSIPLDDQAMMLIEAIKSSDTGNDQFREIVKIYKNQDIDAMYKMMKTDEGISEYEDILLFERNMNWIPKMKEMMGEKRTFFAVGAGHLAGPKGVIQLLRNEGYTVKPVRN